MSAHCPSAPSSFRHGPVNIYNTGTITGFVQLDADDTFINQAGGTFEARKTSDFDAYGAGGTDLFVNQRGGTVHTADNANAAETTSFVNLERFENQGLISLQDGATGDSFTISNTPGGKNLNFMASGNSTLAVDAFLGGPSNSSSDTFTIQGNVSGVTTVQINNTNTGLGVFNSTGIKVVTVTGKTPTGNEFKLAEPIDTGFFNYDLFFTPTGSGFWSLKSFPGAGAHLLPQLVTAAQDIWHQGSSHLVRPHGRLRVLLNGGATTTAYDPGGKSLSAAPSGNITPAVWARGSGGWLDRNDSASTSAYGRTYNYNLDRNLQTMDFQTGLDLGKRDVLSQGDALVFGVLGGFVQANLDYDHLVRQFDFSGGQVGAYATYLKGGLFVDTLFNAHLYELNPNATLGFPNSLNASTLGVRTDTGYRFGSFSGGAFLEPLATIEVMWANIDGFSLGGNTVSFNDDPNVRGRLGLRAGTTMQAWTGTMMEPFVIGSLWGNLSDNNQATLDLHRHYVPLPGQSARRVGRGLGGRQLLQLLADHIRVRQGRRLLRRRPHRCWRQGRHARRLVGPLASRPMSVIGTKRTFIPTLSMSALRVELTSPICSPRSASDPKQTWRICQNSQVKRPLMPLSVTPSPNWPV